MKIIQFTLPMEVHEVHKYTAGGRQTELSPWENLNIAYFYSNHAFFGELMHICELLYVTFRDFYKRGLKISVLQNGHVHRSTLNALKMPQIGVLD